MSFNASPRISNYLQLIGIQLRNNWNRQAMYRANFFTLIAVDIVWIAIEFSLFHILYSNSPTLGSWTREQTYFFLGVFFAADAIYTTFLQSNFWTFSDLINRGDLDILLTKPVNALFLALTRTFQLNNLLNLFFGISIMVRFASGAGFSGGWHWLLVPFWILAGAFSATIIRFFFAAWTFWTDRSWALSRLYNQLFSLGTKPDGIYPKVVRGIILTVLPFGLIGSLPARALLSGLSGAEWIGLLSVWLIFVATNNALWKAGLRRYTSASS